MTASMLAAAVAVLAMADPAAAPTADTSAAPTADTSAAWPSKRDARRVAVRAAATTCRAVDWCTGYEVVAARRCRRAERRTVYCAVAFVTAQGRRCGGVVGVRRTGRGRLDYAMAVPQNCSAGRLPDGPPTTND